MITHQIDNTVSGETYNEYCYQGISIYPHFHKSIELAYLGNGTADYTVNGKTYGMCEGDFAIVLPFEPHSLTISKGGKITVTVFSCGIVPEFSQMIRGMRGNSAVFRCNEIIRTFFESGITADLCRPVTEIKRGALYLNSRARLTAVCAEYIKNVELMHYERNTEFLAEILEYIEQHFREDISVKSAAKALGYSERRLSSSLHGTLQVSFGAMVNQARFEYANRLLSSGQSSITDIAFECGFQSVRTFNRVFKELSGGIAPSRKYSEV